MIQEVLQSNLFILMISLLLIISVFLTKFSTHLNTPSLLFFIGVGMLVGNDGLNLVNFHNSEIAQTIGIMALIIILFDGGIRTDWKVIRPVVKPSLSLATLGVLITASVIGIAAKFIFDFSWLESFLLGSIVGSTDAAAIFSVLSGKNIKQRVEATLEGESGVNDPMAVFLTTTFIQLVSMESHNILLLAGLFIWQMSGGLLIGAGIGWTASKITNKVNLGASGLYPLLMMAFAFLSFSISSLVNASGLLAVYVAALVIGNSNIKQRQAIFWFNEGFSWLFQMFMFIILGLFVIPSDLFTLNIIFSGLLLSSVLIFIARPIAAFLSVAGMGYSSNEKLFFSWAGLRGAVPIVLALFPILAGLENSQIFFNAVFFIVLTSTLIQGTTIPYVAKYLNLVERNHNNPLKSLEFLTVGRQNLELIEYEVTEQSSIKGMYIKNLNFPKNALINIIMRKGEIISPEGNSKIKISDVLYIIVPSSQREELDRSLLEKE